MALNPFVQVWILLITVIVASGNVLFKYPALAISVGKYSLLSFGGF